MKSDQSTHLKRFTRSGEADKVRERIAEHVVHCRECRSGRTCPTAEADRESLKAATAGEVRRGSND